MCVSAIFVARIICFYCFIFVRCKRLFLFRFSPCEFFSEISILIVRRMFFIFIHCVYRNITISCAGYSLALWLLLLLLPLIFHLYFSKIEPRVRVSVFRWTVWPCVRHNSIWLLRIFSLIHELHPTSIEFRFAVARSNCSTLLHI